MENNGVPEQTETGGKSMKLSADLRMLLKQIDHKSYPAYKDTKGSYQFDRYVLSIDHVQGDPFAAPSKVRIMVGGRQAGFAKEYYDAKEKRIALQDYVLRKVARTIRDYSFQAKGSGKSGLLDISQPGQEILERSACQIDPQNGNVTIRMEIGFPANGRTINARELEKILFDFLPACVKQTLFASAYRSEELVRTVHLAEDQQYIRQQLPKLGLAAFVANGSVLPRKSGVSMLPMKDAAVFRSPASMEVEMKLPHRGMICGMGIRKGVTLIVGGGYHGKSTLLKALELGVYNHIAGDGREYVVTDESAVKLRAEDGRSIQKADISMFIRNLPNGQDTEHFYTEDASGSTSQAANTVEAMEAGASLFLIDEDTSATNFMIRDELMQRVVNRESEPIVPFIDRVRELYEKHGISTILVAGSCGSYFHKADCIVQMKNYEPEDITAMARETAKQYPLAMEIIAPAGKPQTNRVPQKDEKFIRDDRIKIKTMGTDAISINRENIDLRLVEQLVDPEQVNALALIVRWMKIHSFDGRRTIGEAVELLYREIEKKGFEAFASGAVSGNLAIPRPQEIYETLNWCRGILCIL